MGYSEEQASDVLEACARAKHEATLAVELVRGVFLRPWEDLPAAEHDKLRRDAALALDLLVEADRLGADAAAADRAVEEFAKRTGTTVARANLAVSVIAAVKMKPAPKAM